MTIQERAALLWESWFDMSASGFDTAMVDHIIAAIEAAVAAERERCAKLAEEVGAVYDTGGGYVYDPQSFAAAIREPKRGVTP